MSMEPTHNQYAESLQQIAEILGAPFSPSREIVLLAKELRADLARVTAERDLEKSKHAAVCRLNLIQSDGLDQDHQELTRLRREKELLLSAFRSAKEYRPEITECISCAAYALITATRAESATPAASVDEEIARRANNGTLDAAMRTPAPHADTVRMDWLESQAQLGREKYHTNNAFVQCSWFPTGDDGLRAAIDAANGKARHD